MGVEYHMAFSSKPQNKSKRSWASPGNSKGEGEPKKSKRPEPTATSKAIWLLARREHSRSELKRKLIEKGFPPEEAESTVEKLADRDYQSDQRFVDSLIRMRSNGGHGPMRIRSELGMHKLESEMVGLAMEECGFDWAEQARGIVERRYGQPPFDFKTSNKAISFLLRRGFDMDVSRAAVKARAEDDEG
jgi:regulatory protein